MHTGIHVVGRAWPGVITVTCPCDCGPTAGPARQLL